MKPKEGPEARSSSSTRSKEKGLGNGTRLGTWAVSTSSADSDLNGHQGTVTVGANPNPDMMGFVTFEEDKWGRQFGDNGDQFKAFVPQYVMINGPQGYHNKPSTVHFCLFI